MNRRLYRCRDNRVLAGVAAGVAEYFDLDPTLVRVLWFISIFFGGVTLVLYIGLAFIMPLEPISAAAAVAPGATETGTAGEGGAGPATSGWVVAPEGHRHNRGGNGRLTTFAGIALVLFGSLALLNVLLPDPISWRYLGPMFIIGIGAVLIAIAVRRDRANGEESPEL